MVDNFYWPAIASGSSIRWGGGCIILLFLVVYFIFSVQILSMIAFYKFSYSRYCTTRNLCVELKLFLYLLVSIYLCVHAQITRQLNPWRSCIILLFLVGFFLIFSVQILSMIVFYKFSYSRYCTMLYLLVSIYPCVHAQITRQLNLQGSCIILLFLLVFVIFSVQILSMIAFCQFSYSRAENSCRTQIWSSSWLLHSLPILFLYLSLQFFFFFYFGHSSHCFEDCACFDSIIASPVFIVPASQSLFLLRKLSIISHL